jgi:hypothetical protein
MRDVCYTLLLVGAMLSAFTLKAQEPSAEAPRHPESDKEQQEPKGKAPESGQPNPNLTITPVPSAGDPLYAPLATARPQSFHQKFMDYSVITLGPRPLFTPALSAAIRMAHPSDRYPPEWQHGMGGFGRLYGASLANEISVHTGRFLTGAVLHEDFRYRPSGSSNDLARIFHAVAFTFVDKSDSGHNQIALANFVGAASGGFVGNLYMPAGYNNLSHAETRTATLFGDFAAQNLLREFAPDIMRVTHKLHLPFPRVPFPKCWTQKTQG